ncbi:MAG: beta-N-acetylglucosaminidase domain-containing protein [Gemmatimonadota bacterium]
MIPELGIVEGFYGRPWSWKERRDTLSFLEPHGYRFYLYAPKGDPWLRKRWREDHPEGIARELAALSEACGGMGVRFGVGLSPFEVYREFDADAEAVLDRKLAFLDDLGVRDLAILFDDMRGDLPDLARRQVEVVERVARRTGAERLLVCPTYYSDDPVLDRVFGRRPPGYLRSLGEALDPAIEILWTGEEVVSREISPGHVERVAETMGRAPFLWDNYPVNDGPRLSRYLHLRAFTGRPAALAERIAGHAVNPALQATLARVPALTLAESYREGDAYEYGSAFRRAARAALGEELAELLRHDILTLQDVGRERLGEKEHELRERYEGLDHPAAREIVAWLDGAWAVTEDVLTQ